MNSLRTNQYRFLLTLGSGDTGAARSKAYQVAAQKTECRTLAEWMRLVLDESAGFKTEEK